MGVGSLQWFSCTWLHVREPVRCQGAPRTGIPWEPGFGGLEHSLVYDGTHHWQGSASDVSDLAVPCSEQSVSLSACLLPLCVYCVNCKVDCRSLPSLTFLPRGLPTSWMRAAAFYAILANKDEICGRGSSSTAIGPTPMVMIGDRNRDKCAHTLHNQRPGRTVRHQVVFTTSEYKYNGISRFNPKSAEYPITQNHRTQNHPPPHDSDQSGS